MKEEEKNIIIKFLANKILEDKRYSRLDEKIILYFINQHFLTFGDQLKRAIKILNEGKNLQKNIIIKNILKEIKSNLNTIYGSFITKNFLKKKEQPKDLYLEKQNSITKILALHKSTRERLNYYSKIYETIFKEIININGIVDLGSGINPISYLLIKEKIFKKNKQKIQLFAGDISLIDLTFCKKILSNNKIKLKTDFINLLDLKNYPKEIFKSDYNVIFLFKVLDSLETIKKNISKKIIPKFTDKYIIISFPTKSLKSKVKFKNEKRNWIRNYLNQNEHNYTEFQTENELFFIIKPKQI